MKKINVMQIVYSLEIGGRENVVVNLANGINTDIFNSSICCLKGGGALTTMIREGVQLFEADKSGLLLLIYLISLLKKEKIDVVHTHNWGALCEGGVSAKLAGVPVIIHQEHGTLVKMINVKKRRILAQKFCFRFIDDFLITVSDQLKESMSVSIGIDRRKIKRILNGVEINCFDSKINKEEKKKELFINNSDIIIGTVGRIAPVKDQKTLIYAFAEVIKHIPDIKLVIVGDGESRIELEGIAANLKLSENIRFLGMRFDIPELLAIMDLFVLPSLHEGISITLLEAMASGLPVIATNVGGNPEVVLNGKTGVLVPPDNPEALAEEIIILLKNEQTRKNYGMSGRKIVQESFSLEKMINNHEELYISCLKKKGII
ncbi:MAG: GT4 family glycosyltransferase PelF [Candidatus Desantisbacteria bacterium]